MRIAIAVILLCCLNVVLCTKKLDLVLVFDQTKLLGLDRKEVSDVIWEFVSSLLDYSAKSDYDTYAASVVYSDKRSKEGNMLWWRESCSDVVNNFRRPSQSFKDSLMELSSSSVLTASTMYSDAYAGIMKALDMRELWWRPTSEQDPVMRAIVVFAGGRPSDGDFNHESVLSPNDGDYDYDCSSENYYVRTQVTSALLERQTHLYAYTEPLNAQGFKMMQREMKEVPWAESFTRNATDLIQEIFLKQMPRLVPKKEQTPVDDALRTRTQPSTESTTPSRSTKPATELKSTPAVSAAAKDQKATTSEETTTEARDIKTSPLVVGCASAGTVAGVSGLAIGLKKFFKGLKKSDDATAELSEPTSVLDQQL